jgi:hypothetical protein
MSRAVAMFLKAFHLNRGSEKGWFLLFPYYKLSCKRKKKVMNTLA